MPTVVRGNTVFFSFVFYDENGDAADVDSAELQLTYPGRDCWETETLTLTKTGSEWKAEWDSAKMRSGWLEYHAHALDGGYQYAQDGRVRITGNRASFDHDTLASRSGDYQSESSRW